MTFFPFETPGQNPQVAMLAAVGVGFGFGFVLERAGFGNSRKLAGQFYGNEMVMLKVMFTAVVTAVLGVTVLGGFGALDLRALSDSIASETFLWPMILGGFLIGVGIILSGYCPGTSIVGVASGKIDAMLAYAGVILGYVTWTSLEWRKPFAAFHGSGTTGPLVEGKRAAEHLYLYDLLHVPPVVLAAALVGVAIGAFLLGEYVERLVNEAPSGLGPAPRRWVFAGTGAVGAIGLVTLALPVGTAAVSPSLARISAPELARRVVEEPWKVRVLDLRAQGDCAAQRIPGAECTPAASLKDLYLGDVSAARDLVVVAEGDLGEVPPEIRAYRGRVLALERGFAGWREWALAPAPAPGPGAGAAERDELRLRAGVRAALTGVQAPPPPPTPAAGGAPVKRKAGGGGCSG